MISVVETIGRVVTAWKSEEVGRTGRHGGADGGEHEEEG
jgi:hypothetical protein